MTESSQDEMEYVESVLRHNGFERCYKTSYDGVALHVVSKEEPNPLDL